MNNFLIPISIKGVIIKDNKVLLVKNERYEWELPGGRIELGETPEQTLVREIKEELGLVCSIKRIVDSWVFEVVFQKHVFIVSYQIEINSENEIMLSNEHLAWEWVKISDLYNINIPTGYIKTIENITSSVS